MESGEPVLALAFFDDISAVNNATFSLLQLLSSLF